MRELLKTEWIAFQKTVPEAKAKKWYWPGGGRTKMNAAQEMRSKLKTRDITDLACLKQMVDDCEHDWEAQDGDVGKKVHLLIPSYF